MVGTYNVVLEFSLPGVQTYSLFELVVSDSEACEAVKTTNTVEAQNNQEFDLTDIVSFTPDATVSDNYSIE